MASVTLLADDEMVNATAGTLKPTEEPSPVTISVRRLLPLATLKSAKVLTIITSKLSSHALISTRNTTSHTSIPSIF